MKKIISGKSCDTEKATLLGSINIGEFGDPTGYEEALYLTKSKQHFIYGNGGAESKYIKPTMELFTDEQAADWLKANVKPEPKAKKKKKQG